MNLNTDIVGGACEEVVDILENIPSDSERRAATDVGELKERGKVRRLLCIGLHRPSDVQLNLSMLV
jgi:hypothetical protein